MYGMGVLINCTDWREWLDIASAMVIVLTSPADNPGVRKERLFLTKRIQRDDSLEKRVSENDAAGDATWDEEIMPPTPKGSTLRETSPFAIAASTRSRKKIAENSNVTGHPKNDLHHPDIARYLESHMFPLAPLWSGIMLGKE